MQVSVHYIRVDAILAASECDLTVGEVRSISPS